jgi:hypothetical protein
MTFELYQGSDFFRPYSLCGKELNNIIYFNENGKVLETGHGWMEKVEPNSSVEKDVKRFNILKMPIRKVKPNFSELYAQKQPFYMTAKRDYRSETRYDLYVPFIPEEWSTVTETSEWIDHTSEYARHIHRKEGYTIVTWVKNIPIESNVAFIAQVRELFKLGVHSDNNISDHSIISNRVQINEAIKNFKLD